MRATGMHAAAAATAVRALLRPAAALVLLVPPPVLLLLAASLLLTPRPMRLLLLLVRLLPLLLLRRLALLAAGEGDAEGGGCSAGDDACAAPPGAPRLRRRLTLAGLRPLLASPAPMRALVRGAVLCVLMGGAGRMGLAAGSRAPRLTSWKTGPPDAPAAAFHLPVLGAGGAAAAGAAAAAGGAGLMLKTGVAALWPVCCCGWNGSVLLLMACLKPPRGVPRPEGVQALPRGVGSWLLLLPGLGADSGRAWPHREPGRAAVKPGVEGRERGPSPSALGGAMAGKLASVSRRPHAAGCWRSEVAGSKTASGGDTQLA